MKTFKHLDLITTAFAVVLILSNITSTKILSLGWFSFDGGTILFPPVYIFGAILAEVYRYARARRVIWIGFAMDGCLPLNLIWIIWVSNYIFKILVEIILLPVTYRVAGWLKKREEVDYYDTNTNFNPLKIK